MQKAPSGLAGLSRVAVLNSVQTHAFDARSPILGAVVAALVFFSICIIARTI
jgi:hypothetical protein